MMDRRPVLLLLLLLLLVAAAPAALGYDGPDNTVYLPFSLTFRVTTQYPPNENAFNYGYALGQQINTTLTDDGVGFDFRDYWTAGVREYPAFWSTQVDCCHGTYAWHEYGTISFLQTNNVLDVQGYGNSGSFGATPAGYEGNIGAGVFNVTGGKGVFSEAFGTCSYIWNTPWNLCTYGIRIQCGVWVPKANVDDGRDYAAELSANERAEHEDRIAQLYKEYDATSHSADLEAERAYPSSSVAAADSTDTTPPPVLHSVPGPNNLTKLEFNLVFVDTADYSGPVPINKGPAQSAVLTTDLTSSNGPVFSQKLIGTTKATWNTQVVVNPPFQQWSESGTISFSSGTINIETIGSPGSGWFANLSNNWDGSFGAAYFNINGGTGTFKGCAGMMASMWQTPFNPGTYPVYAWGLMYCPSANVPGAVASPNIPNKSC